jgi:hypothetical protein
MNYYDDKIFLTLDLDWAIDEVFSGVINIIDTLNATIFITHDTPLLTELRKKENIELGIHPNFRPLLSGEEGVIGGGYKEIIDNILKIIPEAYSTRSHALLEGSDITRYMHEKGIIFDLNTYIPLNSMKLSPYLYNYDIIKVPFFYEDDIYFNNNLKLSVDEYLSSDSLKVFNFHPINIFLNIENGERYKSAYNEFHNYENLKKHVNQKRIGTRDFLYELIDKGLKRGFKFMNIKEIQANKYFLKD